MFTHYYCPYCDTILKERAICVYRLLNVCVLIICCKKPQKTFTLLCLDAGKYLKILDMRERANYRDKVPSSAHIHEYVRTCVCICGKNVISFKISTVNL